MPIASGASGRVDAGSSDAALKTSAKSDDSYLQRWGKSTAEMLNATTCFSRLSSSCRYLKQIGKKQSGKSQEKEARQEPSSDDREKGAQTEDGQDAKVAQPTKKSHLCVLL
ncbi:uncharacterized protein LOC144074776 [Stigmatopora argus]